MTFPRGSYIAQRAGSSSIVSAPFLALYDGSASRCRRRRRVVRRFTGRGSGTGSVALLPATGGCNVRRTAAPHLYRADIGIVGALFPRMLGRYAQHWTSEGSSATTGWQGWPVCRSTGDRVYLCHDSARQKWPLVVVATRHASSNAAIAPAHVALRLSTASPVIQRPSPSPVAGALELTPFLPLAMLGPELRIRSTDRPFRQRYIKVATGSRACNWHRRRTCHAIPPSRGPVKLCWKHIWRCRAFLAHGDVGPSGGCPLVLNPLPRTSPLSPSDKRQLRLAARLPRIEQTM